MKFPDLRKYFFSYLSIVFSILAMAILWLATTFPQEEVNVFPSSGDIIASLAALPLIAYFCCFGALIFEILFRHFVIKKYFPNLKAPYVFKMPKLLNIFLSSIFYILFVISTLPMLFVIFALLALTIDSVKNLLHNFLLLVLIL
ncbi:MAG: hypothetical protein NC191_03480 [Muribaculaceae bacterium]|nr:hypothetical protein [Muribaculaceae bacterium]